MTKKVPPGGQKMNFGKNRLHEVDRRAMPIGKMVSLLILPFGNPKSANGRHPYLRKLFSEIMLNVRDHEIRIKFNQKYFKNTKIYIFKDKSTLKVSFFDQINV